MLRILRSTSTHIVLASSLFCAMGLAGCQAKHPDDKAAVYSALDKNLLDSVVVDQDREKGLITLTGIVGSEQSKAQAQTIAQNAAPGYTIQNNLSVNDSGMMKNANPKDTLDPGSATTMPSH